MSEDSSKVTVSKTPDTLAFFKGFLDNPERVGSVIPSSRFLERRIVETADISRARLVVELGPGTGGTTRAMLRALPPEGRLLTIEINPEFAARLAAIDDPRLINHVGSAVDIDSILAQYGLGRPDAVVSGIPFSTMPPTTAREILSSLWSSLGYGGRFVAYQFRSHVARFGRELFGSPDVTMELRNAPPMRLYRWLKPVNGHAGATG
ncbi:MAG: methyltransferase type 12 [Gammaproteobacteria bacterium]|nr:methyltransferase type 12 [Gammaproteobacteria bacterium]